MPNRRLLARWRGKIWPVIHVRHDSTEPRSQKHANNAFIGTDLQTRSHDKVVVIANSSVEATVRMAGNLGIPIWLAQDAYFTFAHRDWNGTLRNAQDAHTTSLANLAGEYCIVIACFGFASCSVKRDRPPGRLDQRRSHSSTQQHTAVT